MTKVVVNSRLCGFVHRISGERKGNIIDITVDSPCQNVCRLKHLEVPINDIFDIRDNYVMKMAQENGCSANCLAPNGILQVCWIEAGLLLQTLCDRVGCVSVDFKDE